MFTGTELNCLFSQVFGYSAKESGHRMGFLVDVPVEASEDTTDWRDRRALAMQWARLLSETSFHACMVYAYKAVRRGNADLVNPVYAIALTDEIPPTADALCAYSSNATDISEIYSRAEFWVALTQYSATAPLKVAAARFGFRAATMPGFALSMLPALSIDITALDRRVSRLARDLTDAHTAVLTFGVRDKSYTMTIDLRHRMGFASSGRFLTNGQAGNLPSGEAYIVPYEGERQGTVSRTGGILPIERNGEMALCEVSENRIVCIDGENAWADTLRQFVAADPARANIAELGLGVLGEWGIEAVGHVLLDEKLAVHIALGRSEHLGGVTSPSDFKAPEFVCHIDHVYHKKLMPHVCVTRGVLLFEGREHVFVENDRYCFDATE